MDETKRQEIIKFFASMSDESLALSYELSLAYILKKKNSGSDNLVLPSFEDIQGNGSLEPEVSRPAPPEVEIPAEEKALNKSRQCPFCAQNSIVRNGHKDGKQRFLCKSCRRSITYRTNTIMSNSQQSDETWRIVLNDTLEGISLDKTAKKTGISRKTVFTMRQKILCACMDIAEEMDIKLSDVAELDETFTAPGKAWDWLCPQLHEGDQRLRRKTGPPPSWEKSLKTRAF